MIRRSRLVWESLDFGQLRARSGDLEFTIWSPKDRKKPTELRIVRREDVGGIIVPFQDFTVYATSTRRAVTFAERFLRESVRARGFDGYLPL